MQQPAASGDGPWQLLWSSGAGGTARDDDIELGVPCGVRCAVNFTHTCAFHAVAAA
jgi:hypothetical protein